MSQTGESTRLLRKGRQQALNELFPIVYGELHEIASALFRGEFRTNHTLQPTAWVHKAFLRLDGGENEISWQNHAHFFRHRVTFDTADYG
jgi:hypothetical protein